MIKKIIFDTKELTTEKIKNACTETGLEVLILKIIKCENTKINNYVFINCYEEDGEYFPSRKLLINIFKLSKILKTPIYFLFNCDETAYRQLIFDKNFNTLYSGTEIYYERRFNNEQEINTFKNEWDNLILKLYKIFPYINIDKLRSDIKNELNKDGKFEDINYDCIELNILRKSLEIPYEFFYSHAFEEINKFISEYEILHNLSEKTIELRGLNINHILTNNKIIN